MQSLNIIWLAYYAILSPKLLEGDDSGFCISLRLGMSMWLGHLGIFEDRKHNALINIAVDAGPGEATPRNLAAR